MGLIALLLLWSSNFGEAQPRGTTSAIPVPFAKPPVKGEVAVRTWALAASDSLPLSAIEELHPLLTDPDRELRVAAAWALGHLRVRETGEEARAYDEAPRMAKQTKPYYPEDAFYRRIQGVVRIEFVIDETGRVVHAEVRQSIGPLDRGALACVREWRFTPAKLAGKAVPAVAGSPVSFRIDR